MGAVEPAGVVAEEIVVEGLVGTADVVVLQEEEEGVTADLEMIDIVDLELLEFAQQVRSKAHAEE